MSLRLYRVALGREEGGDRRVHVMSADAEWSEAWGVLPADLEMQLSRP